jgi:hypothetical protein
VGIVSSESVSPNAYFPATLILSNDEEFPATLRLSFEYPGLLTDKVPLFTEVEKLLVFLLDFLFFLVTFCLTGLPFLTFAGFFLAFLVDAFGREYVGLGVEESCVEST